MMKIDEAIRRLSDSISNCNDSVHNRGNAIQSELIRQQRAVEALHARVDALMNVLYDMPEAVLRRMDIQSINKRRKELWVQQSSNGEDLPPPPVSRHIKINRKKRDDEDTAVNFTKVGLELKLRWGHLRKLGWWFLKSGIPAAGLSYGVYLWQKFSHLK